MGDTIFKGAIGSVEYPGGNPKELRKSIMDKIFTLLDATRLYSGHTQMTTVGQEKARYGII